tara:strand:+ start:211 stop:558 length:348 start_codon:yes stop_codon:yes gene_type:complete
MEKLFTLDRGAFHDWLEGQPYGEVVGNFSNTYDCPLGNFLSQEFEQPFAYVSARTYGIGLRGEEIPPEPTPPWARKFLCHIQNHCDQHGDVYVDDCLRVLTEKCSEVQHPCTLAA